MRLLLDTHILLWRLLNSERLSKAAIGIMDNEADELLASTASVWEVAIKSSLSRKAPGRIPISGEQFMAALDDVGIEVLPIKPDHAIATEGLPRLHGDPFDRLLIATAQVEELTLLTGDTALAAYGPAVRVI